MANPLKIDELIIKLQKIKEIVGGDIPVLMYNHLSPDPAILIPIVDLAFADAKNEDGSEILERFAILTSVEINAEEEGE